VDDVFMMSALNVGMNAKLLKRLYNVNRNVLTLFCGNCYCHNSMQKALLC